MRTSAPAQGAVPTTDKALQPQQGKQASAPAANFGANKSTEDLSEIDLAAGTNATLFIEDPDGRRTGKDPANNRVFQDIPQSAYFEDRIDNAVTGEPGTEVSHLIQVSQPKKGTYRLFLTGLHQGNYDLTVSVFSKNGTAQPSIHETGNMTSGLQVIFQLEFTPAPETVSTLTKLKQ